MRGRTKSDHFIRAPRALYMGELRKNTTSTGTITKKKPGYFGKIETVGTKIFFYEVNFFYSLINVKFRIV